MLPNAQMWEVASWLLWLAFATTMSRPLALRLVPQAPDGGWIIGAALGWTLAGAVPWALAALGLIDFAQTGPIAAIMTLGVAGAGWKPQRMDRRGALFALAALALFGLGLLTRLQQADLQTLEKPMDVGLVAASMRAVSMPPLDPWFAGETVNYYYVGHAMAGSWGRLANVPADHAYQLTMATLFALTGLLGGLLAASLAPRFRLAAGTAAAALLLVGGNLHVVLYTLARKAMTTLDKPFRFPDSTRYIGFDPVTNDKAFTEFVSYSFKVGDLHAHVLATPLVLLGALLLWAMWRAPTPGRLRAVAFGALLGLLAGVNAWDLATLGLSALVTLVALARRGPLRPVLLAATLALTAMAAVAALFMSDFKPFGDGIAAVSLRTPLWQLGVVYGQGLLAVIAAFALMRRDVDAAFTARLAVTVLILVLLPEVVRVKDIYGDDYARANTMFKLSFRAQMWLPIIAAASVARLAGRPLLAALVAVPALLPLLYLPHIWPASVARDLSGQMHLSADTRALIAEMDGLPDGAHLEAAGDSYGPAGRVAAFTGRPTPLGWHVHEWLWRSDKDGAGRRRAAVAAAYEAPDNGPLCALAAETGLRWIVLGTLERETYKALNERRLLAAGPTVFESGPERIIALAPETCRAP